MLSEKIKDKSKINKLDEVKRRIQVSIALMIVNTPPYYQYSAENGKNSKKTKNFPYRRRLSNQMISFKR